MDEISRTLDPAAKIVHLPPFEPAGARYGGMEVRSRSIIKHTN
jgi:hypothetical protein